MTSFMLEVLAPDKTLYWGRANSLQAKAIDGEVEILAKHAPYVAILAKGKVDLITEDDDKISFDHDGGILEVARDKTSVLVKPVKDSA